MRSDMWNPTCNLHYCNTTFKVVQFRWNLTNYFQNAVVGYPTTYFEKCCCRVHYNLQLKCCCRVLYYLQQGRDILSPTFNLQFFRQPVSILLKRLTLAGMFRRLEKDQKAAGSVSPSKTTIALEDPWDGGGSHQTSDSVVQKLQRLA